jgi:hypothetical protein
MEWTQMMKVALLILARALVTKKTIGTAVASAVMGA